jgi:hypothetical protein
MPFLPPKCYKPKNVTPTPSSIVFIFRLAFESFKECGGVSHGIKVQVKLDPPIVSMALKKNCKPIHETMVEKPTQDLNV